MCFYLISIREYNLLFQSLFEPVLGPGASSNDYLELIILLFQYNLEDNERITYTQFIDSALSYGIVEVDAEIIFYEASSLLSAALKRMLRGSRDTHESTIEIYNDDTFLIRQTEKQEKPISAFQVTMSDIERRMVEELNNGCWLSERQSKLYPLLREYAKVNGY